MKRLQRDAVLLQLIDALGEHESWCGETHVQKALYFLQELGEVDLGFEFILYKYGPYSFDLKDELTALRADQMIRLQVRKPGYGASIVTTEHAPNVTRRFPQTVERHRAAVQFIATRLGDKGVAELERLATALLVAQRFGWELAEEEKTAKLCDVKPHVSAEDALDAVAFVDDLRQEWAASRATA